MRKLAKPHEDVATVFSTCISTVDDLALKKKLASCSTLIVSAANDYDKKGVSRELHKILPMATVGAVSKDEMESIYNYRMVRKAEGREIYDRLLTAPFDRCPLCNQRRISTLDHYLPISKYPIFAVTPVNLVPACWDCNKIKRAVGSDKSKEMTLHPYYDDIENDIWLDAELIEEIPVVLEYKISPPAHWKDELTSRVKYHFNTLGLDELYGSHAAEEIVSIRKMLKHSYDSGGSNEVRADLQKTLSSREKVNKNSWQTVLYRTLFNSAWFHDSFKKKKLFK